MNHFYECKRTCERWAQDLNWLSEDWTKFLSPQYPELFARETMSDFNLAALRHSIAVTGQRNQQLASMVLSSFKSSSLRTRFSLLSRQYTITFEEVVGFVARST